MEIKQLLENNKNWSRRMEQKDPGYFEQLSKSQTPSFLWIGCADSRVPANEIVGLYPGELFVHRNVANLVYPTDSNCMTVLEYSINVLKVRHVIVCGHYGCGGVQAAMSGRQEGLTDGWLSRIRNLYARNREEVDSMPTPEERVDRLCELNVLEQATTVSRLHVVQSAWLSGAPLHVHAWIYGLKDGTLKPLDLHYDSIDQVPELYRIHQAPLGDVGPVFGS